MNEMIPWLTLIALGLYHGINPGMGWLFAVALGLQERSRKAVIRAFVPIAIGHAISIAVVVLLVAALQSVVSPILLRWAGAGILVAYGLYKLLAPMSHPRWVGMRVGMAQLALWSFLMATAHGAGLMVVPVLLNLPDKPAAVAYAATPAEAAEDQGATAHVMPVSDTQPAVSGHAGHAGHADHAAHMAGTASGGGLGGVLMGLGAVGLHTLAMFAAMALVAMIVYEKVGLAILRRAWFNLDVIWAGALIGAGVLTLVL